MKTKRKRIKKLCCYCSGTYVNHKCDGCKDKANFKLKKSIREQLRSS